MKRIATCAFILVALISFGQSTPQGFNLPSSLLESLPVQELQTFDHERLREEDDREYKQGGMAMSGRVVWEEHNCNNEGTWITTEDGGRIWLYRFKTENAQAVGVLFNDFHMPVGAEMYIYGPDFKYFDGPYTVENNKPTKHFRTADVYGDEAILEYYEPAGVVGTPHIGIMGFIHQYRFVYEDYEAYYGDDRSLACEVDVNCPEGSNWVDQRNSVVRLGIVSGSGTGFCSGALVNNTAQDCRNFILTAHHCIEDINNDNYFSSLVVRFNYQKSGCGTGTVPTNQRTGVTRRADSNDGGGNSGSDFALLELDDAPAASWNAYYAGWDAGGSTPQDVTCIHHPDGDVKKISYSSIVSSGTWAVNGFHWRVIWEETQTNHGVTEPGSSGSPIFDQKKQIVGTLTGGGSCCTTNGCGPGTSLTEPDYYGKMSKHWNSNPNPATEKLKVWLDPSNTGVTNMNGAYKNASGTCAAAVNVSEIAFNDISIYPTLVTDQLNISTTEFRNVSGVRIFDGMGKLVYETKLLEPLTQVAMNGYAPGVYFITFIGTDDAHVTKKFTVAN
jgi:hypothetical protein